VGIGIQKTNAGIGIPASIIPVRYRRKKCRTASLYYGTGLLTASLVFPVRYRTDRMPDSPAFRYFKSLFFLHENAEESDKNIPGVIKWDNNKGDVIGW
jgi:hypothetical protein